MSRVYVECFALLDVANISDDLNHLRRGISFPTAFEAEFLTYLVVVWVREASLFQRTNEMFLWRACLLRDVKYSVHGGLRYRLLVKEQYRATEACRQMEVIGVSCGIASRMV